MLSRLRGHRLSQLKSHWEQTGNCQSSFSINTEARETWIARIFSETDNHAKDRMLLLFNKKLLNTNRRLRPSARQILHKLEDLDRLVPSDSHLLDSCCKHADLDALNGKHTTSISMRFQFIHRPRITAGYALPSFSRDYTFVLLDFDLKVIAWKNSTSIPEGPESKMAFHFGNPALIGQVCHQLRIPASKMLSTRNHWNLHRLKDTLCIREHTNGIQHALLIVDIFAIRDSVSTERYSTIRLPSGAWSERMLQLFLIPIDFPKVETYASFFYMIAFRVGDDNEQRSNGNSILPSALTSIRKDARGM
jgi:hypothetical protein